MKITHRVPWNMPYGYTEVEADGFLTEEDRVSLMFEVAAIETAYREAYNLPKIGESPMVDEAFRQGAVPATNVAPAQPTGPFYCKQCHGPAAIRPNAKPYNGEWPAECQGQCRNPKNPKYALATWVK